MADNNTEAVKQPQNSEKRVIGRPFQPGQSGNPKGRPPKEWTMSSLIEEALEEVEEKSGKSFKSLVAKRLAHMAVGGDIQAIKEINDRIDGRPQQKTDITSNGKTIKGNSITFQDFKDAADGE